MCQLLEAFFKRRVVNWGYPDDLELDYSIGFSQGDHVSVKGALSLDEVKQTIKRLGVDYPWLKPVDRLFSLMVHDEDEMLDVYLEDLDSLEIDPKYYASINLRGDIDETISMFEVGDEVAYETYQLIDEDDESVYVRFLPMYKMLLRFSDALEEAITDDLKDLESELLGLGQDILLAFDVENKVCRRVQTSTYSVEFRTLSASLDDILQDEYEIDLILEPLSKGDVKFKRCQTVILDRETEEELAVSYVDYSLVNDGEDPFKGLYCELLSDAREQYESLIEQKAA